MRHLIDSVHFDRLAHSFDIEVVFQSVPVHLHRWTIGVMILVFIFRLLVFLPARQGKNRMLGKAVKLPLDVRFFYQFHTYIISGRDVFRSARWRQ